jgi:hypothetical protein
MLKLSFDADMREAGQNVRFLMIHCVPRCGGGEGELMGQLMQQMKEAGVEMNPKVSVVSIRMLNMGEMGGSC